ncbi:FG-GAP-like repeat-containing protein [Streptomyces sp. NPDC050485]|uniref:FG-GAP-like repeat-containing protein n=1 Tax=Streptomyces sp. NPDC050485 TaxID=3365617 RepID=UPI00379C2BFF
MPAKSSRAAWTTALLAAAVGLGLTTAVPASALTGSDAASGSYAFTAKLNIGEATACTGALVDPQWVITAASCFTIDGKPAQAGKPAVKTTVTVGRADLSQAGGSVQEAVELVPRTDRDVVMVKLARRILDPKIKPVQIAAQPAATSETLTSLGFGRTKTEWVPNQLHSGVFTVASASGSSVNLNGSDTAVLCQGDAGSPAVRMNGTTPELVAVNSLSWQGGCLGNDPAETRTSATDVRVDDLGAWIQQTAFRAQDDLTGDGIADLAAIWGDGSLHVYPGDKAKGLSGANIAQLGGTTWKSTRQLAKGDFTNDGVTDLMDIWDDGTLHLYKGDGKGKFTDGITVTEGGNTWGTVKQMTAGDFDGDGIADLMAVWTDGSLHFYKGKGDGQLASGVQVWGGNTWGTVKLLPGGDFDGDGIADLMAVWSDGSLHFYKGKGDGQVTDSVPVWGGNTWGTVKDMTAGDYTGDGIADLMAIWSDGTLHLYKGNGKGGLTDGVPVWGGNTWGTVIHIA